MILWPPNYYLHSLVVSEGETLLANSNKSDLLGDIQNCNNTGERRQNNADNAHGFLTSKNQAERQLFVLLDIGVTLRTAIKD